jgi:hypothetical protein
LSETDPALTADLTDVMSEPKNHGGVPTLTQPRVASRLPAEWVPEGEIVRLWARQNAGYGWETVIPEFSIAGMGDTLDSAIDNAIELLDDYLLLCEREGKTFAQCRRPLPMRDMARLVAEFSVGRIVGKLSFGRSGAKKLDLPLHALAAH